MTEQQRQQLDGSLPDAEQHQLPQGQEQPTKTLAIRVEANLHTQLQFIAQLSGTSITEEIRRAIESRITSAHDDPELLAKAHEARQQIEREAAARSAAIAGFIGKPAVQASANAARPAKAQRTSRQLNK